MRDFLDEIFLPIALSIVCIIAVVCVIGGSIWGLNKVFDNYHGPYSSYTASPIDHESKRFPADKDNKKIKCFLVEYNVTYRNVSDVTPVGRFCKK